MKYFESFLYAFISISLHEMAHIITALIFRIEIKSIKLLPVGLMLLLKKALLVMEKSSLLFSRPIANVLLYISGQLFCRCIILSIYHEYIIDFANTNLYLAIFNILRLHL